MTNIPMLGPLEQEVLNTVWQKDCVRVNCVLAELNAHRSKNNQLAYTTIMTILTRLVEKGILKRKKQGRGFLYEAVNKKQCFIANVFKSLLDQFAKVYGKEAEDAFLFVAKELTQKKAPAVRERLG